MMDEVILETAKGPVGLRPEQPEDAEFLYALFRSHTLPTFAALPVDEAMKESLVRMQFNSQTATYRAQYPDARFAILERGGATIGRTVLHETPEAATIVDMALMPGSRGDGMGSAVMAGIVAWIGARCPVIRCMILFDNAASLGMCRRAGFVAIGETPPHVLLEWRRG
jgi:RimJ/RimL family protein N-acetyltransferase